MLSEEDQKLVEQFALGEELAGADFDRDQFQARMLDNPELALAVAAEVRRLQLLHAVVASELSSSQHSQPVHLNASESTSSITRTQAACAIVAAAALFALGIAAWNSAPPQNQQADIEAVAGLWATLEPEPFQDDTSMPANEFDVYEDSLADFDENTTDPVEDFSTDWMSLVAENYFES